VDVLGTPPATAAETAVQAEHRLNLARQIGKMATRIDRRFLATSDVLITVVMLLAAALQSVNRLGRSPLRCSVSWECV